MKKIFSIMISSLLVTFLITGCSKNYDETVSFVRSGHFEKYPSVTVGDAFDQFFVNGKWHSFISTNDKKIVQFEGDCSLFDMPAKLTMQFVIEGQKFSVEYMDIDDIPMNQVDISEAIDKIMTEYKR